MAHCGEAPAGGAGDAAGHVVFIVTLQVKPGKEQAFLEVLMPVLDRMRHEATFVNTVLHVDPGDPCRFMLYETWSDLDVVAQVQIHRDYRRGYLERLPELLAEERRVEIWRPLRADRRGAAPLRKAKAGA